MWRKGVNNARSWRKKVAIRVQEKDYGSGASENSMGLNIYLLRHGQTELSKEDDFCGSGIDPGLTDAGAEMADAFADAYADTAWEAIYCSPLKRAVQTATPLCKRIGQNLELRDGLKEIAYGKWEGLTQEKVQAQFHDDYLNWTADPAWHAPTDGELAVAISYRSIRVIEEIRATHKDGNALVVSHKATIRIILCSLLGIDVGRYRYRLGCPVSSVSRVEFTDHGPMIRSIADTAHLSVHLRNLPGT